MHIKHDPILLKANNLYLTLDLSHALFIINFINFFLRTFGFEFIYFMETLSSQHQSVIISFRSVCSFGFLVHFFAFNVPTVNGFCRCCISLFFMFCEKFHSQIFSCLSLERARARVCVRVITITNDDIHTNRKQQNQKQFLLSKRALRISPINKNRMRNKINAHT